MFSIFTALQYLFKWLALKEEINVRFALQKEHERIDEQIYQWDDTISSLRSRNNSIDNMRADRMYDRQLKLISYQEALPTYLPISSKGQTNTDDRGDVSATNG